MTLASISLALVFLGCGSGHHSTSTPPDGLLSGNWQILMQQRPPSATTENEAGFLVQSGNSITGSLVLSGQTQCAGVGSAGGNINGFAVSITLDQIAQTVILTGTAASDGSTMQGSYSTLASGCADGSTIGTWTASQVKPLYGTYQGTFTSTQTQGLTYTVSLKVAEGPNTGTSTANLTGTMTSNSAPCFSNLPISGIITGTSVAFNLYESDGSAIGQYRPTTTLDATKLTGDYEFNPATGGCAGDVGTATMSLQQP